MKRYRPLLIDFDYTSRWLELSIDDTWDEDVKELHRRNRNETIENFGQAYGTNNIEQKIQNAIDIGSQKLSVLSYHNEFYRQARSAFIIGAYFPALAGTCALGERILNHLVLQLRADYFSGRDPKRIGKGESFTDWKIMIDTLARWGVFLPEVVIDFHSLAQLRRQSLHFNPASLEVHRENAVRAIEVMNRIVYLQFGILGSQPWFIPDTSGAAFVKQDWEGNPFVREFILPACALVGPNHRLNLDPQTMRWTIQDDEYANTEVSDEEFRELFDSASTKLQNDSIPH